MTISALGLLFVLVTSTPTCDVQSQGCFGLVSQPLLIQQTEVTNAEYVDFLNSVATVDDPAGLWNPAMSDPTLCYPVEGIDVCGGIERSGVPGDWHYASISGRELHPVNLVSWYDALRYVNWLDNDRPFGEQGPATTEDGTYTFSGPTSVGPRNPNATVFLPNEDEWYAAAYWDPALGVWVTTPTDTSEVIGSEPSELPGTGNCDIVTKRLTDVGSYPGSKSGAGALDMAGNIYELDETEEQPGYAVARGSSWGKLCSISYADHRFSLPKRSEVLSYGFRVGATLPEPSSNILLASGILFLTLLSKYKE